jgi:hypothetical protein
MATRIITNFLSAKGDGAFEVVVQESFENVLDRVAPTQPHASALAYRTTTVYTKLDGDQCYIPPSYVVYVGENEEID